MLDGSETTDVVTRWAVDFPHLGEGGHHGLLVRHVVAVLLVQGCAGLLAGGQVLQVGHAHRVVLNPLGLPGCLGGAIELGGRDFAAGVQAAQRLQAHEPAAGNRVQRLLFLGCFLERQDGLLCLRGRHGQAVAGVDGGNLAPDGFTDLHHVHRAQGGLVVALGHAVGVEGLPVARPLNGRLSLGGRNLAALHQPVDDGRARVAHCGNCSQVFGLLCAGL